MSGRGQPPPFSFWARKALQGWVLCFTGEMKISFCSHHHIATEGCQRSRRKSEITENILNLIFCVRQAHAMLIVGLVKSLSWLPVIHRLRSKAYSWHTRPSGIWSLCLFFSRSDFWKPRRCPSEWWVLGTRLWDKDFSSPGICILKRRTQNYHMHIKWKK